MAEVIKGSSLQGAGGTHAPRLASFNFADIHSKADAYLVEVRAKAAEIIAAAHSEAEQIKIKAQHDGRQAALQAAEASLRKHVETQLNRVLPALEHAADQLVLANAQWQQQWDQELVKLSTAIAGRIVRRELTHDAGITVNWVREALEMGMGSPSLAVHLHPDDVEVLKDRVQEIASRLTKLGSVKVVADPAIDRGGCQVRSEYGVIDQTVPAQLARIEQELN